MSMMYPNGIITSELCPFCDNPEPVAVRHGCNNNGSFVHDYDCDVCGGDMSIVGYPCPECAVSLLTKDAPDRGYVCKNCGGVKMNPSSKYCYLCEPPPANANR